MKGGEVKMKVKIGILGLVFAALFALGRAADAQLNLPTDGSGASLPPSEAPCVPFVVSQSTPTNTETLVRSSGPGYLSHVILSTGAATSYIVVRDTGSVSNSGIAPLVWASYVTANAQVLTFQPPLRFVNGITVRQIGGADITNSATLCTRLYGTQTP